MRRDLGVGSRSLPRARQNPAGAELLGHHALGDHDQHGGKLSGAHGFGKTCPGALNGDDGECVNAFAGNRGEGHQDNGGECAR
jgi:hypothetical protein